MLPKIRIENPRRLKQGRFLKMTSLAPSLSSNNYGNKKAFKITGIIQELAYERC
jgi:hypothetical protein